MTKKTFYRFLDSLCQPDPGSAKDNLERTIQLSKNRGFLLTHFAIIPIVLLFGREPEGHYTHDKLITLGYAVLAIFSMVLTARRHRTYFNLIYFTMSALFVYFKAYADPTQLGGPMIASIIIPVYILYFCDSKVLCFLSGLMQIILIHILFKPRLTTLTIEGIGGEDFGNRVVITFCVGILFNIICVNLIYNSLKSSIEKNKAVELDKFERQKFFLMSFSHELRNLVNSVLGNIEIALQETNIKEIKSSIETSRVSGEVLLHLFNNILDSGKTDVGELEISPTEVKIYSTIKKIWMVASEVLKKKALNGS